MEERGGRVCKKNWPEKEKRKYTKERREKATKSRADIKKEKKRRENPWISLGLRRRSGLRSCNNLAPSSSKEERKGRRGRHGGH